MTRATYPYGKNGETGTLVIMFREDDHFLSNFWPCKVTLPEETIPIGGKTTILPPMEFSSTEQAYMAWKTTDQSLRLKIQNMSPGDAKKETHKEDFPTRPDYSNEGRLSIMRELNQQKYSRRNPQLRAKLIGTGQIPLIEGNTWGDIFFGFDLTKGQGANHLGRILMDIRSEIYRELEIKRANWKSCQLALS